MKTKAIIARTIIVVAYLVLAVVMFLTGRTHTLLVDNRGAEDGSYRAVRGMEVTVNKYKPLEFNRNDRDSFTIKGQSVKLHIEFFDGSEARDFKLKLPLGQDTMFLSVPKLLENMDDALVPFTSN